MAAQHNEVTVPLDLVLRQLLQAVSKLKIHVETQVFQSARTGIQQQQQQQQQQSTSRPPPEDRNTIQDERSENTLHELLDSVKACLKTLNGAFASIDLASNGHHNGTIVADLVVMSPIVCLPLNAILMIVHSAWPHLVLPSNKSKPSHREVVRSSKALDVVEATSNAINAFISLCGSSQHATKKTTNDKGSNKPLSKEQCLKLQTSLTLILSDWLMEHPASGKPGHNRTDAQAQSNHRQQQQRRQDEGASLNRGTTALCAVLRAVASSSMVALRTGTDDTSIHPQINGDAEQKEFEDSIMIRLVDVCSSIISKDAGDQQEQQQKLQQQRRKLSVQLNSEAIRCLKCLLQIKQQARTFWQQIFPGVFTAQYRLIKACQQLTVTKEIGDLHADTLEIIILLFESSMRQPIDDAYPTTASMSSSWERQLNALSRLAVKRNSNSNVRNETDGEGEGTDFVTRINSFVVSPLRHIVVTSATCRAVPVRLQTLQVINYVLLTTRMVWKESTLFDLLIETSLMLTKDTVAEVAQSALGVFLAYQSSLDRQESERLATRIYDQISGLPTSIERGRLGDVHAQLVTLSSYLVYVTGTAQKKFKTIASSNATIKSLVRIAIPNLETVNALDENTLRQEVRIHGRYNLHQGFRKLDDACSSQLSAMLRAYGKALGVKLAAIVVDACIADFCSEYAQRRQQHPDNFHGTSQVAWIEGIIGYLCVARHLLLGAFATEDQAHPTTANERTTGGNCNSNNGQTNDGSSKKSARRRKMLKALIPSIMPVLVGLDIWTIPFNSIQVTPDVSHNPTQLTSASVSPAIMDANISLMQQLIHLCETICCFGEEEEQKQQPQQQESDGGSRYEPIHVCNVLPLQYLILAKAASCNPPSIRAVAITSSEAICAASGHASIADFIVNRFDNILSHLKQQISASSLFGSDGRRSQEEGLNAILLTTRSLLVTSMASSNFEASGWDHYVTRLVDFSSVLIEHVDPLMARNELSYDTVRIFVDAVEDIVKFIHRSYRSPDLEKSFSYDDGTTKASAAATSEMPRKEWKKLLDPFLIDPQIEVFDTDNAQNTDDGNGNHLSISSNTSSNLSDSLPEPKVDADTLQQAVDVLTTIIARAGYCLSMPTLKVQISSTNVLITAFRFLALIGAKQIQYDKEKEGSGEGYTPLQNSILRQVADVWHTFRARFVTTSDTVLLHGSTAFAKGFMTSIIATSSSTDVDDIPSRRWFLARLFELIGFFAQSSGEFFVRRFRTDVWPVMAKLLGQMIDRIANVGGIEDEATPPTIPSHNVLSMVGKGERTRPSEARKSTTAMEDSELNLITSILQSMHGVFCANGCGEGLVDLIAHASHLLFPFLGADQQPKLAEIAFDILKRMLELDSSCLLRPLFHLSGRGLPPSPFHVVRMEMEDNTKVQMVQTAKVENLDRSPTSQLTSQQPCASNGATSRDDRLATAACKLLDLLNDMPEP